MVLTLAASIERRFRRRRRRGKVYVNILQASRVIIGGKEYLVRRVIGTSPEGIVVEDLYGNIRVIPFKEAEEEKREEGGGA